MRPRVADGQQVSLFLSHLANVNTMGDAEDTEGRVMDVPISLCKPDPGKSTGSFNGETGWRDHTVAKFLDFTLPGKIL